MAEYRLPIILIRLIFDEGTMLCNKPYINGCLARKQAIELETKYNAKGSRLETCYVEDTPQHIDPNLFYDPPKGSCDEDE